ncbi:MAG: transglutaminase domain-containing protein [Taibaiella sp.]|nr:transglutaminase domain-containing protein [Taibaiella sp.]
MIKFSSKILLIICVLIISSVAGAQETDYLAIADKYKNENAVITNNTEHLVIKYENGEFSAISYITEERLLISSMSPGMYNTQNIYHSYFNKLGDLDGVSMIPDKRGYKTLKAVGYKTTASERENVFYDDGKQTEITYKGLTRGALTRLTYTIIHRDIHFLTPFYFQNYIPVITSTFKVTVPKFVKLNNVIKGHDKNRIKQEVKATDDNITYTWTANDIPSLKSYTDAPPFCYYALHLLPYISSYQADDNPAKHVLGNPDDLYHYYYKFIKNVNQKDEEILTKTAEEITHGDATPKQKAQHIYQWVQKNMHYVAFEDKLGGFVPREAADICMRKFGDCKDMTSILVALCRKVGIEAYFTWIGTRDKPYTYEETPLPLADNHMICTIKLDDQWVFMDGTDPLIPFGIPPYSIQGKEALIGIDATNYKIIKVPEIPAANNYVCDSTVLTFSNNTLTGTARIGYKGYRAWYIGAVMMYRNDNEKEKAIQSITTRGSNKFLQNSFDYNIAATDDKDAKLTSTFEIKDYVQNLGKEYYVNMNLLRSYEGDFADRDRTVPIEHDYKNRIKQVVTLQIPKGYKVTYLPPNKEKSVNGLLSYRIAYTKNAKEVQLVKEYELQTLYVYPEQFAAQNQIVEELKKQYKESVVLTAN